MEHCVNLMWDKTSSEVDSRIGNELLRTRLQHCKHQFIDEDLEDLSCDHGNGKWKTVTGHNLRVELTRLIDTLPIYKFRNTHINTHTSHCHSALLSCVLSSYPQVCCFRGS